MDIMGLPFRAIAIIVHLRRLPSILYDKNLISAILGSQSPGANDCGGIQDIFLPHSTKRAETRSCPPHFISWNDMFA